MRVLDASPLAGVLESVPGWWYADTLAPLSYRVVLCVLGSLLDRCGAGKGEATGGG